MLLENHKESHSQTHDVLVVYKFQWNYVWDSYFSLLLMGDYWHMKNGEKHITIQSRTR